METALALTRAQRCHSQIVLDAAAWVQGLPGTVRGVFFPKGGDAAGARKIRSEFVAHYGLPDVAVPLLQLDEALCAKSRVCKRQRPAPRRFHEPDLGVGPIVSN